MAGESGKSEQLVAARVAERGRAEWWLLVGVVAFLSLVLVMWRVGGHREPPAGATLGAPDFDLPTLAGDRVRLRALKGRVVLVHFWATWCPPCVEEAPYLSRLYDRLRGRPFDLVAVSVDDGADIVRKFFGTNPPAYKVALDPGGGVAHNYGTFKYPETYLVGPQGQLLKRYIGPQNWTSAEIAADLDQALSAAASTRP